jgi:predicted transcriptional regulator
MKLLETSAKNNTNVSEAFNIMAKEIIEQTMEKEKNIKKDNDKKEKISLKPKGKEISEKKGG